MPPPAPKKSKFHRLDGVLNDKHEYDIEDMTKDEHGVCFQPSKMTEAQKILFHDFLTAFENASTSGSAFALYTRMPGSPPPP